MARVGASVAAVSLLRARVRDDGCARADRGVGRAAEGHQAGDRRHPGARGGLARAQWQRRLGRWLGR
eukprot:150476-Chlamydomonas_euryale.AAC.1